MPPKRPKNASKADESKQRIPFHFHAEGHAFSAEFHRPIPYPIGAQASVSLPSIGGHAHSRVENFIADHLVRFTSAQSHVSGSWMADNKIVTTNATTVIEGLNILDYIVADRIVARLTSEHHVGEKEGHFLAIGTAFEGLKIGGHDVKVTLRHELFVNNKTFADLRHHLANNQKPDKIAVLSDEVALCSLVEDIDVKFPGLRKKGHILYIDHFGEIAFGEVFAALGSRTLTMLRLRLGSPDAVIGTVAELTTNGQPMPPLPPGSRGN
jgi:hypothetical protein